MKGHSLYLQYSVIYGVPQCELTAIKPLSHYAHSVSYSRRETVAQHTIGVFACMACLPCVLVGVF